MSYQKRHPNPATVHFHFPNVSHLFLPPISKLALLFCKLPSSSSSSSSSSCSSSSYLHLFSEFLLDFMRSANMGFCHSGLVSSDHYVLCKAALVVEVTRWIFFWAQKFVKHYVCLFSLLCFEDELPSAQTSSSSCSLTMAMENLSLTTFRDITEERESCHDMSCVVCLMNFKNRDQVWKLSNCSHVFHKQCLERWLRYDARMTCPLCRTSLIITTPELPPQQPSWAVERILYLFGDDLLYSSPYSS